MSGILGMVHFDSRDADPMALSRMIQRLAHRGPEGFGQWTDRGVALGHLAFYTTPESRHESFPFVDSPSGLVITADARIDNREALLAELSINGRPREEIGDGEIILAAYERWGEGCPEKLIGDFAFAIWDPAKRTLFAARDHLGVRPFYYAATREGFVFASEIKSIWESGIAPRDFDLDRIADYLALDFEDKAATFYRAVRRLPPAHSISVSRAGVKLNRYWSLDLEKKHNFRRNEEYAEAFRELFIDCVRARTRSSKRLGFFLSGGIDSASVIGSARALGVSPLPAFSATFPEFPRIDETSFVNSVVEMGGVEPHFVPVDRLSPLAEFNRFLDAQDEPFHGPNLFVYTALAREARREGSHVLLDGLDGDTIVAHGLEFLAELLARGRWARLASELFWLRRRFGLPAWRFLRHYGFGPLRTPDPESLPLPEIMNRDFVREIGWDARFRERMAARSKPANRFREEHARHLESGLLPFYLEVYDKAAAAEGIDHRHPFYDRRLMEFCLALPGEQRLQRGWDRSIERRGMKGLIPERIERRVSKSNWEANFERALIRFDRKIIESTLLAGDSPLAGYVDGDALRRSLKFCNSGQFKQSDVLNVWVSVTLGLWLEREMAGQSLSV